MPLAARAHTPSPPPPLLVSGHKSSPRSRAGKWLPPFYGRTSKPAQAAALGDSGGAVATGVSGHLASGEQHSGPESGAGGLSQEASGRACPQPCSVGVPGLRPLLTAPQAGPEQSAPTLGSGRPLHTMGATPVPSHACTALYGLQSLLQNTVDYDPGLGLSRGWEQAPTLTPRLQGMPVSRQLQLRAPGDLGPRPACSLRGPQSQCRERGSLLALQTLTSPLSEWGQAPLCPHMDSGPLFR